jgi:amino acid transporter
LAAVTLFGTELLHLAGLRVDWVVVALLGWLLVGGLAAGGLRPAVRAVIVFEAAAVVVILALMAVVVRALASGTAPRGQRFDAGVFALPAGLLSGTLVLAAVAAFLAFCGFESAGSLGGGPPPALVGPPGDAGGDRTGCGVLRDLRDGADVGIRSGRGGRRGVRRVRDPSRRPRAAYAGPGFAALLHAMALVSAVGAGLGCLLAAVRMLFALGRDGRLPTALARVSPGTGAPSVALVVELTVGLALIVGFRLAAVAPDRMFFVLATFGVLNLLVMYAVTDVAAVHHLRRTRCAARGAGPPSRRCGRRGRGVRPEHLVGARGLLLVLAGWLALAAVFALVGRPRRRTP